MNKAFIVILMFFCHVIADYNLQGWLASAKQKEWWQKNAPDIKYKYDYIICLIMHSISWTFMIMLPIAWYNNFNISISFIFVFIANLCAHCVIDDAKANKHLINLWSDQLMHIAQIVVTSLLLFE